MKIVQKKWIFLIVLSLIWGSSFILIKKSLLGLSPLQVGALRILFAAVALVVVGYKTLKGISKNSWKWIAISGFLGTFFPAFFFAFAETEIDSTVTSILNSITPIMTLIIGSIGFAIQFSKRQLLGVIIGLLGSLLLIWTGADVNPNQNYNYALFVLMACVCYAFNVNIIKKHLQHVPALGIAAGNFVVLFIPALIVLVYSGFFTQGLFQTEAVYPSLGYVLLLALLGTGVSKVMFNKLVQISSPVFSTSVTYTIPIVALMWGYLDGERFTAIQFLASLIILAGVLLSNKRKN